MHACVHAQVDLLAPQELRCPISLEAPPLCAQITPCGHVFAFPSIMAHLLHHGGSGNSLRRAAPCPLCFQPIVARELRLARAHAVRPAEVHLDTNWWSLVFSVRALLCRMVCDLPEVHAQVEYLFLCPR